MKEFRKPRELKLKARFTHDDYGYNFDGYDVVEGSITMDNPHEIYHLREVVEPLVFDEHHAQQMREQLDRTKLALEKAKDMLSYRGMDFLLEELEAIEKGERNE